ncbi:sulfotransferase [Shewanella colwelliana]|uniref:sulfotransferase n=1 Tax=Shewanella colwelliana TaxID=23 RepID=UPI003D06C13A
MTSNSFDRPIIILSAPRSGSTLLFEILSKSKHLWTIGGESHGVIEKHRQLNITHKQFESNALDESDWSQPLNNVLQDDFRAALRNSQGEPYTPDVGSIRFLEKTPKNSLRIDFLNKVFPDARFIFLVRDPKENVSSIMQAWRSQRFRTYPGLPGWNGDWSLLLPKGWQKLKGAPLESVATFQWQQANETIMQSLTKLAPERWQLMSYHELIASPQTAIAKLTQFCDIPFDDALQDLCRGPLPFSRYTVSKPAPNKWVSNFGEIQSMWPQMQSTLKQINTWLTRSGQTPLSEHWPAELAPTVDDSRSQLSAELNSPNYADVGRNAPCPCGSTKRFKHCHGKLS